MSSLIWDKGYDGDGFRAEIVNRGAKPVIPNKSNRVTLHSFSKRAYKGRNVIERCFCRLKDFRRVATRYDKLARERIALWAKQTIEYGFIAPPDLPEFVPRGMSALIGPKRSRAASQLAAGPVGGLLLRALRINNERKESSGTRVSDQRDRSIFLRDFSISSGYRRHRKRHRVRIQALQEERGRAAL